MKRLTLIGLLIFLAGTIYAQGEYEKKQFVSQGDTLNYRLLRPEPGQQQYPLVLFLHGGGERGSDNEKQLSHGSEMFRNPVNREKYPAYVLYPQCPEDGYWAYRNRPETFTPAEMPSGVPISPVMELVVGLLDEYLLRPDVDIDRVYVIGLSMGGMGTFDLACRYPELLAAAIPICGTVNPARLEAAKNVHFRIFHGDKDSTVPVSGSREAYKALKQIGADVEYIEFPGVNHDSWTPAFNYPDFMEWLFEKRRKTQ
ncbi:MAG: dienelactone hydrolase family protein [Bacteroides sp.]|nr:dienelactone hydrolase family protein [Bacteroides sp.]